MTWGCLYCLTGSVFSLFSCSDGTMLCKYVHLYSLVFTFLFLQKYYKKYHLVHSFMLWQAGAIPCCHWVRGGVRPGQCTAGPQCIILLPQKLGS